MAETPYAGDEILDARYQVQNGVTSISPATMTLARESLAKVFEAAGGYDNQRGSTIRGISMEGPFVSVKKKGAQNGEYIHEPDVELNVRLVIKDGIPL